MGSTKKRSVPVQRFCHCVLRVVCVFRVVYATVAHVELPPKSHFSNSTFPRSTRTYQAYTHASSSWIPCWVKSTLCWGIFMVSHTRCTILLFVPKLYLETPNCSTLWHRRGRKGWVLKSHMHSGPITPSSSSKDHQLVRPSVTPLPRIESGRPMLCPPPAPNAPLLCKPGRGEVFARCATFVLPSISTVAPLLPCPREAPKSRPESTLNPSLQSMPHTTKAEDTPCSRHVTCIQPKSQFCPSNVWVKTLCTIIFISVTTKGGGVLPTAQCVPLNLIPSSMGVKINSSRAKIQDLPEELCIQAPPKLRMKNGGQTVQPHHIVAEYVPAAIHMHRLCTQGSVYRAHARMRPG